MSEVAMDPVTMYQRAADRAAQVARTVRPDQQHLPTPCSDWDVAALLEHMSGGVSYLLGALEAAEPAVRWPDPSAIQACVSALREPGALERRCMSPANFEWSVAEATAGTAMDQLIHAWDLSVAIGQNQTMDPEVVEAIVTMFLPQMPQIGRQAGLVGPEVPVPREASPQERLLGAMGRDPRR